MRKVSLGLVLTCGLLLALSGPGTAQPAPGTVDTSFGSGGIVTIGSSGSEIRAMTVDTAGRVVAVGRNGGYTGWVIVRFLGNGDLDPSFGTNGQVILFGQNSDEFAMDVAFQTVQNEERIVVVGLTGAVRDNDFTIVRLRADGSMDPSFGSGGIVRHRLDSYCCGSQAVAIQPDGKILVGGFSFSRKGYGAIALARYTIDGNLDVGNFGPPDKKGNRPGYIIETITDTANDGIQQRSVAIQPDGKIVAGAYTGQNYWYDPNYGWTVARYNADGTVDTGFGTNGKITETTLTGFTYITLTGVGFQSDGSIIASGRAWNDGPEYGTDIVVLRYDTGGNKDYAFGQSGLARTWLSVNYVLVGPRWNRLGIQADDKIVVGGAQNYPDSDLMVFRFLPDGNADISFGTGGRSELIGAYPESYELAFALAIDPATGGIYVAGLSSWIMAIAKFHGDPMVTTPPAAPTNLVATAVSSSRIDLSWTDTLTETGFRIWRSLDGSSWALIAVVGADVSSYQDTGLASSTTYFYQVSAYNAAGSAYSDVSDATTQASVAVDYLASGDLPVAGTVSGTFVDTQAADDTYQSITEIVLNHPLLKKQYNYLEHRWTFNVTQGSSHVFHVQAYRPASVDGDDFVFAYSTDGSNFINMLTVTKTDDDNGYQTCILPSNLSGTVYVRVMDTDRTKGVVAPLDTVFIDHMFIRSE